MGKLNLLLDTNAVIDYIARRGPEYNQIRLLMLVGRVGEFGLWITASQATDLVYILSHGEGHAPLQAVLEQLRMLRHFVGVLPVDDALVDRMFATTWSDPEDALIYETSMQNKLDAVITCDKDFPRDCGMNVFTPSEFFEWCKDEFNVSYAEIDY